MLRFFLSASDDNMPNRPGFLCGSHSGLRPEQPGEGPVDVMEMPQVRDAAQSAADIISVDMVPGLGMKIIPLSKAKV